VTPTAAAGSSGSDAVARRRNGRLAPPGSVRPASETGGTRTPWLILGIVLLVIAGGVIVNPVIFVFAVLALAMFVMRLRHA
jgi:hypothetical protein